jgi:hypothetical protein
MNMVTKASWTNWWLMLSNTDNKINPRLPANVEEAEKYVQK